MNPGVAIPLAVFTAVVLIVALVDLLSIHGLEVDVQHKLHRDEADHREKIRRLEEEIRTLRGGRKP